MEVTRQLLTERASKQDRARIQFTFCRVGQHLRLSSGQKVAPKACHASVRRTFAGCPCHR